MNHTDLTSSPITVQSSNTSGTRKPQSEAVSEYIQSNHFVITPDRFLVTYEMELYIQCIKSHFSFRLFSSYPLWTCYSSQKKIAQGCGWQCKNCL